MNQITSTAGHVPVYTRLSKYPLTTCFLYIITLVGMMVSAGLCADALAQQPPASPPSVPAPTPAATPEVIVTPGSPAASDTADYRAARTPQAIITLDGSTSPTQKAQTGTSAAGPNDSPALTPTSSAVGGVFPSVDLAAPHGVSATGVSKWAG